jgi:hypothetical protein
MTGKPDIMVPNSRVATHDVFVRKGFVGAGCELLLFDGSLFSQDFCFQIQSHSTWKCKFGEHSPEKKTYVRSHESIAYKDLRIAERSCAGTWGRLDSRELACSVITDRVATAARFPLPCQGEEAYSSEQLISFAQILLFPHDTGQVSSCSRVVTAMVTYFLQCCQATMDFKAKLSNIEQRHTIYLA